MQCPECKSTHIRKNGIKKGKNTPHLCQVRSPVYPPI
ncbi:transposase-like zinc-binding domain-containing protein [Microcoleus sp. N3A4]